MALNLHFTAHMDVLDWWKTNSPRFLHLSIMACDLLSIPVTIVASESAFSIGSRILNKYRNCLSSNCVEAIICSRNWKHGFNEGKELHYLFYIILVIICQFSLFFSFFYRWWWFVWWRFNCEDNFFQGCIQCCWCGLEAHKVTRSSRF